MVGVSDIILNYASSLPQFSVDDMPVAVTSGIDRNTLSWHLSNLCRKGKLRRVGRGVYTSQPANMYNIKASAKASSIYRALASRFPFADFCVYSGSVIAPLLHDMTPNNNMYIETNREVTESVFNMLLPKYQGRIFISPTKEELC